MHDEVSAENTDNQHCSWVLLPSGCAFLWPGPSPPDSSPLLSECFLLHPVILLRRENSLFSAELSIGFGNLYSLAITTFALRCQVTMFETCSALSCY